MRDFGKILGAVAVLGFGGFFVVGCSSHSGSGNGNGSASTAATPASTTPTRTLTTPTVTTTTPTVTTTTPVTPTVAPSPAVVCTTDSPTDPALAHALATINASRAQFGVAPLLLNTCEQSCALRHSQDLSACVGGNFANVGSSANGGSGCAHLDFRNGDRCGAFEENQGLDETTDEIGGFDTVHQMMMAEGIPANGGQNHCTNILNASATSVAIGLYVDPSGVFWVTEDFIR